VKASIRGRANWVDSEEMPMLYSGPYSTSFYHRLYAALHTEFRIRKATAGRGIVPTTLSLLGRGRIRRGLSLLKDGLLLPLHRARLERERRRARPDASALPVELTRTEAATPTAQDGDAVAGPAQRRR
jgi:hypothetical protein